MNGFKRYNNVLAVTYVPMNVEPIQEVVKSNSDVVLDTIFARDDHGWPQSSISVMLSKKTSDDLRKYIEDNIMLAQNINHIINNDNVVQEFGKLDSEFLAQASRNRFETIEQYESRINAYIEQQRSEDETTRRFENYKKLIDKVAKSVQE